MFICWIVNWDYVFRLFEVERRRKDGKIDRYVYDTICIGKLKDGEHLNKKVYPIDLVIMAHGRRIAHYANKYHAKVRII